MLFSSLKKVFIVFESCITFMKEENAVYYSFLLLLSISKIGFCLSIVMSEIGRSSNFKSAKSFSYLICILSMISCTSMVSIDYKFSANRAELQVKKEVFCLNFLRSNLNWTWCQHLVNKDGKKRKKNRVAVHIIHVFISFSEILRIILS